MKTCYDEEEDILNIQIKEKGYWKSIELANGLIIDISKDWKIIGIEIPEASKIFKGDTRKVIEESMLISS